MEELDLGQRIKQLKELEQKAGQKRHPARVVYTLIFHEVRDKLGLTIAEYCIGDLIDRLSNSPESKKMAGWCFASREYLAECLGYKKLTAIRAIDKLVKLGLIEKHPTTKYVRTTRKWWEEVVTYREKMKK